MTSTAGAEIRTIASEARLWFPRSWAALGIGLLLLAVVALPALFALFMAYVFLSGCFMECTAPESEPGAAAVAGSVSLVLFLLPFVGMRFFQGRWPASPWARLGVIVLLVVAIGASLWHFLGFQA